MHIFKKRLTTNTISTEQGNYTLEQIEHFIYIPLGYKIKSLTQPLINLEKISENRCDKVRRIERAYKGSYPTGWSRYGDSEGY